MKSLTIKQLAGLVDKDQVQNDLFSYAEVKNAVMSFISKYGDRQILWKVADIALECKRGYINIEQCYGKWTLNINGRISEFYL